MALKLDSTNNYALFINESKYENELNSIEDILLFLSKEYLKDNYSQNNKNPIKKKNKDKNGISMEQSEWMKNPNHCPACGFFGIKNKEECPDCGLNLK